MEQTQRRIFLIKELLKERGERESVRIPTDEREQKYLLRALFNIRRPKSVSQQFIKIQDEYLREEIRLKGITDYKDLKPAQNGIYLWQGDITTLRCSAIVNAANSGMTGCYVPNHSCIDNAIHTYSGIQLRLACDKIIREQGSEESVGTAKITPAFNLPCDYVIHTVGPYVSGRVSKEDEYLLESCYLSCLNLAEKHKLKSMAFCCISTGEFHFSNDRAAQIAVNTVNRFKRNTNSELEVIFNVFKDSDLAIYKELLTTDK